MTTPIQKRVEIARIDRFSPSMIGSYMECPMKFYYQYVAKVKLPSRQIHLVFGSGIHDAIEAMYKNKNMYEAFDWTFEKKALMDEEKNQYDEFRKLGYEMIKNYKENVHYTLNNLYDLDNGESELYVRKSLVNPLTDEKTPIPMSGRIDRLTNNGNLVEYKTSKNKWTEKDQAYQVQTKLYNLWYYSEYGELPKETIHIILLKKHKEKSRTGLYQVLTIHHTLEELASTFDEVMTILDKIKVGEFDRPSGFHPNWCDCFKFEKALNFDK